MPAQTSSARFDVVIIGNGISGLSLAYALARADRTLSVGVVGPRLRPGAATLAAGAMLNAWGELTPGQLETPVFAERAEVMLGALPLWDPLCADLSELAGVPLHAHWGTDLFTNTHSAPQEHRTLRYIRETLHARGEPAEHRDAASLPWLDPAPGTEISAVLRLPDGWIAPDAVLQAYEQSLDRLGVAQIASSVRALDVTNAARAVQLENGDRLSAGRLVLANGSFAQTLIDPIPELCHAVPRLLYGAGTALDITFDVVPEGLRDMRTVTRTSDRGGQCGVHLVPAGERSFYFGATSRVWLDPASAVLDTPALLRPMLLRDFHGAFSQATITTRAIGYRPTSADGFPLLGESHLAGVWFANGMKRDGFTSSPLIARELANALLGRPHGLPERFRPSRPLISHKSRAQAIEETIEANLGGLTRHGLSIAPQDANHTESTLRRACEAIYEKRNLGTFGVPPDLLALYQSDEAYARIAHVREKT